MTSWTFRKFRGHDEADENSVKLTLFRGTHGQPCGWYLGPISLTSAGFGMPFLPMAKETLASVAVVRAIQAAKSAELPVSVIDPDDLWGPTWGK